VPDNLWELHDFIFQVAKQEGLSVPQTNYAVGWIFFDLFERAGHEKSQGKLSQPGDIDRFAQELAPAKIARDLHEAQQNFGREAAEFMEPEIQNRIRRAIDNSIVTAVKAATSGRKAFIANVLAGVVSGALFAIITISCYYYVKTDPSLNAAVKAAISRSTN